MIHQEAEHEFSYYQNCFSLTLRGGVWKRIPNNTLAAGDIIKLLPDDYAPALVVNLKDIGDPFMNLIFPGVQTNNPEQQARMSDYNIDADSPT